MCSIINASHSAICSEAVVAGALQTTGDLNALEANALSKRYGRNRWALRDVSVAIPAGGITALVGPNAAGKSTLLRTWVGFERPTQGEVRVHGHDPRLASRAALRLLGYVPQTTHVYGLLTVAEHIEMVAQLRPGFDRASATTRLSQLGIPLSARGQDLSGGEQAQVVLALAMATHARVLLLDEPLAHLDPLARREFLRVVQSAVSDERRTAVLSSHVVADVEQSCDSIIVLGMGRLLLHATIAEALVGHSVALNVADPATRVATFPSADGSVVHLSRTGADQSAGRRAATLEEVVMGYLSAAKGTAG